MMLSELTAKLMELLRTDGDMKVYLGDDSPVNPLWTISTVRRDSFCPDCNTPYCEIDLLEAPEDYFDDNECCI
jgi:hypothetical protein